MRLLKQPLSEAIDDETIRNIRNKAPAFENVLQSILNQTPFQYVIIENKRVLAQVKDYVERKDVHVVAAAILSQCDYIVSYDKAHLVGNTAIEEKFGIKVITPGDLLEIIRTTKPGSPPSQQRED